jgi:hypothetical protein
MPWELAMSSGDPDREYFTSSSTGYMNKIPITQATYDLRLSEKSQWLALEI